MRLVPVRLATRTPQHRLRALGSSSDSAPLQGIELSVREERREEKALGEGARRGATGLGRWRSCRNRFPERLLQRFRCEVINHSIAVSRSVAELISAGASCTYADVETTRGEQTSGQHDSCTAT